MAPKEQKNVFQSIFEILFSAKNEQEIDDIIVSTLILQNLNNWYPLAGNESNFGIIENQQSNPVAAIVEKLTNSIGCDSNELKELSGQHQLFRGSRRGLWEKIKLGRTLLFAKGMKVIPVAVFCDGA